MAKYYGNEPLEERNKEIVRLYCDTCESLSMRDIAKKFGITHQRVQQIIKRAMPDFDGWQRHSQCVVWPRHEEIAEYPEFTNKELAEKLGRPESTIATIRRRYNLEHASVLKETPEERFFRYVEKTSAHWMWTGSCTGTNGIHPHFAKVDSENRQYFMARRFSWELAYGDIPDGYVVFPTCGEDLCVKPEHLKSTSHADMLKERRDIKIRNKALSKPLVIQIRWMFSEGNTMAKISRDMDIDYNVVRRIVRGLSYKNIEV